MLLTLMLSAALAGQVPPPPPAPPAPPAPPSSAPPAPPAPPEPPEPPAAMDADGDGIVTREEFVAPLNDAFARLDEDGDGRLSSEEFAGGERDVHVFTRSARGPGPHRFQMRRESGGAGRGVVIIDGDGPADIRTERRVEIRRLGDRDGALDKNGDGKVSEEEFLAPMREAFRDMDPDRSGALEDGERSGPGVRIFRRGRD